MASDLVEEIGISRALERSSLSDLRIVLSTDGEYPDGMEPKTTDIVCIAKDDEGLKGGISGITGAGVDDLKNNIWCIFNNMELDVGIATRERHRTSMVNALDFLNNAIVSLGHGPKQYDLSLIHN